MFYCINNCFVEFVDSLLDEYFFVVRFFAAKKDGSTGPTALENFGPYFEIMRQ